MSPPPTPSLRLAGRRVLVVVTGGIAAYKAPHLVRELRRRGAAVRCVMTGGAQHFTTTTTLQAVSGQPVRTDLWDETAEAAMGHIELARWADDVVVAPATADFLARLRSGRADDLATTLILATTARIWLAPAMNHRMWKHAATVDNLEVLVARGLRVLEPDVGDMACGEFGPGRMREPTEIADALDASDGTLAGVRVMLTAGPTYEDLDPVRYLGNRSSGRMGFAIAGAAAAAGAAVTLVAGPVCLDTPPGVDRVDVRTAAQMHAAVLAGLAEADWFIGVAAVADYRPRAVAGSKIKKTGDDLALELVANPDILAEVAAHASRPRLVAGFAAETENLEAHARTKLDAKGVDLIAANLVGSGRGFEVGENSLEVFTRDDRWSLPAAPKSELARDLVARLGEFDRKQQEEQA